MRLNCPGCGTEYEIEDIAIPDEGREVQCSACNHGWFQYPAVTGDAGRFGAPDPFVPPVRPAPRPAGLDDIRAFLRQEAEEETRKRRAEGVAPPPPSPPPLPVRDVSAIDSSLRPVPPKRSARGFGLGLFATLILFLLVAGVYVSAPRLAAALPEFRDALTGYVAWVDGGRVALDDFANRITAALGS